MQQDAIIYFDIAAVVIMLISLLLLVVRKPTRDAANRVYLTAMILVTVTAIASLAGEVYDAFAGPALSAYGPEVSDFARITRSSLAMLYYLLHSLMAPTYLILIATVSGTTHRMNDSNVVRFFMWAPMLVVAAFILTNPFHHLLFVFQDGVLHRQVLMQVLYAEAAYYTVTGIIWLVYWRRLFSAAEFVVLFMLYPVMMAVTAIQYHVQGLRLEMFVTSIAMMLVSAFAIHQDTRKDSHVEAASMSAYREMVRRAFATDHHLCLVYVETVNLEQLRQLVGGVEVQGLIRGVSKMLTGTLERDDILYYLHNGAFCIASRNVDADRALQIAQRAHEEGMARAKRRVEQGSSGRVVAPELRSCIVRIPEDISDVETLKQFGKSLSRLVPESTVTTYRELSGRDGFQLQMALSDVVSRAIRDRSFEVHYQPICCLADGRFHSAEALVRLNDPDFGWVSPALFIPDAEQSGTIVEVGDILLEKICAFLGSVDYEATGLDYVEVNLSVDQCIRPEMADELLSMMRRNGVEPSRVNAEITETSASYSQQAVERTVRALADEGVTLSLDDYGTGYSNVARMLSLPFSLIKVDKTLTDRLDDPDTRTVVAETVATMKRIGKNVLVEGVETREQAELLKEMGVDYIQGYYYARPMPEADFVAFLHERNAAAGLGAAGLGATLRPGAAVEPL